MPIILIPLSGLGPTSMFGGLGGQPLQDLVAYTFGSGRVPVIVPVLVEIDSSGTSNFGCFIFSGLLMICDFDRILSLESVQYMILGRSL